ncbi:hypothetical protein F5Y04DRAFT_289722 [Hypomontagnella monticulosa]|nr:hypothetical protein F5Y04DRAFT_289722 [Hypomontagnella monticulosa]
MAGLRLTLRKIASSSGYAAMNIVTLPYYRFFRQNTLLPILAIAKSARLRKNDTQLVAMLSSWRDRKLHELYFVQVAGTLLSAAVIGCFSWEAHGSEHWIGPAARYCSLVLSLFAILLSASQSFIFTALTKRRSRMGSDLHQYHHMRDVAMVCRIVEKGDPSSPSSSPAAATMPRSSFFLTESESGGDDDREKGKVTRSQSGVEYLPTSARGNINDNIEVRVRWNMVFTWQAPMMLLAYSVIAFLVGLTVYICNPLYDKNLRGREAAIFYLASLGVGGSCFMWCSFWAYKFVDLDEP